ncbi:MAG: hypothetical protein Q4Q22_06880, partial [Methanosphaera sp.]|nr:hypothetical protein [Methanosphaera sp.]
PNQQMPNQHFNQMPPQQMPNQQFNQQVPNQQFNQMHNQQVSEPPIPNRDFTRVPTEQIQNADNQQNYYNPPEDNIHENTQNTADMEDSSFDDVNAEDTGVNNMSKNGSNNLQEAAVEDADVQDSMDDSNNDATAQAYYDRDNLGTNHDTVEKATAYWLGERFQSEYKPPFTMYVFDNPKDAEEALLELPYIHKAADTGNLICDEVFIYGYYKVSDNNYEAIVCGKDLTYKEFTQAEEAFEKHGGTRKNNLEPDKNTEKIESSEEKPNNGESSVKYRETINRDQFTYECYDADNKNDALEFLKSKDVNQRLYYICVYTPEGDYGKDIDGVYQM